MLTADTTRCSIHTKVVDISPEAGCVKKYVAYTLEYLRPSYKDEHTIVDRCMHAEALQAMCIRREEKYVQVEMIIASVLDFHELRGNQAKKYFNYLGKPHLDGGTKESMMDLVCWLGRNSSCVRNKYIKYFIFLFYHGRNVCGRDA